MRSGHFSDLHDVAVRAQLDASQLKLPASSNALSDISGNRGQAMWNVAGSVPDRGLLRDAHIVEEALTIAPASEGQELVADYLAWD